MLNISIDSRLGYFLELANGSFWRPSELATFELDYAQAIDAIPDLSAGTVTQLSATRVELTSTTMFGTYTMSLTGSGLSPVSSLQDLLTAIDQGVATGAFSRIEFTGPAHMGGTPVVLMALDTTATGYTLTSGNQTMVITGSLPSSMAELFQWADAYDQLARFDTLTAAERSQLSSFLDGQQVSALQLTDNGETVLGITASSTQVSLSFDGYTLTINGAFPGNLGQLLDLALQVDQLTTFPNDLTSLTQLTHLGINSITVTGPDNSTLLNLVGPITDEASTQIQNMTVNGIPVVQNGVYLYDVMAGEDGFDPSQPWLPQHQDILDHSAEFPFSNTNKALIFGLGGQDQITGSNGDDIIIGGSGGDDIFGLAGNDSIRVGSAGNNSFGSLWGNSIITGMGNDTVDFTDVESGWNWIDYRYLNGWNSGARTARNIGVTVDVDGIAETASVNGGALGTDTFIAVGNALDDRNGLDFVGTSQVDTFNYVVGPDQWISARGEAGNDVYNLNLQGGLVRLNFHSSPGGAIIDLSQASNQIINDGHGFSDTLNLTGTGTIEVRGTNHDDLITGSARDEQFILRNGTDRLDGGAGVDTVRYDRNGVPSMVTVDLAAGSATGTWNSEVFSHTLLNIENVRGSKFDGDMLLGSAVANRIEGNGGDDTIDGRAGDDYLKGQDGDDRIIGGLGNDTIRGGEGTDTAVFNDALYSAPNTLNILLGQSADGLNIGTTDGHDFVANDVEFLQFSDQTITFDQLAAMAGPSGINGTDASEAVNGTANGEQINARGGSDWINPNGGSDTIDGGDGFDMVSFANLGLLPGQTNVDYRMVIDLGAGTGRSFDSAEMLSLTNVERVTGTIYADWLRGDAGDNQLRGLGHYDWFVATTGNDTLDGGTGRDMVSYLEWGGAPAGGGTGGTGGSGAVMDVFADTGMPVLTGLTGLVVDLNDLSNNTGLAAGHQYVSIERITGSSYQDVFFGDDQENDLRGAGGYDWFVGSAGGRERYFGGSGVDTVTYYNSTSGVIANLSNGARIRGQETGSGTGGDAAGDLYFEMENIVGTLFDDSLTGNSGRNSLNGLAGDDMIFGLDGVDRLKGGAGNDTLDGGAGSDYAIFNGNMADYTLTRTGSNTATAVGTDGSDSLIDVEYFVFDDGQVSIWSL
jgi:Ca2+-binding RTX toxin-like protein